ncbi:MAG: Ig-like domain-containing protein [Ruminiclostridium sp.]|nr:Ig-like domain-containing protein [Ruminiclostridium sp.]
MQYSTDGASWSTTVPTGTNADSYTVYYKIDETDEVNGVTSTPVNVSIARKAAVVTADNKNRTTLEIDPELTATVTGLVGSDTVNYTLSRAAGEDVGTYTITPGGDTEQGNYTVTYQTGTFTITEGVIAVSGITLNKTSTTLTVGGSETLTATVLPADATDKTVTWTTSNRNVAVVANGVVTATGVGTATVTAKAGDKTASCTVTVSYSGGGNNGGGSYTPVIPYYPTGGSMITNTNEPKIEDGSGASGWGNIASEIGKIPAGGSVTVDMNGTTTVPTNVLNALKGKDVDLVLDMGGGITWTINGKDISSVSGSIDLGVKLGTSSIPVEVRNNLTGEHYSTTIHLNHSGKFGFKAVMTLPLRKQDAGLYSNLYYYNPSKKVLEFVSSAKIDKNGNAELDFNHASDYAIVIVDHPLGGRDVTAKTTGNKVKLTWDAAP